MDLENIDKTGIWGGQADKLNSNFQKVDTELTKVSLATVKDCGYFVSIESLNATYTSPTIGMRAYVGNNAPYAIYTCTTNGSWTDSGQTFTPSVQIPTIVQEKGDSISSVMSQKVVTDELEIVYNDISDLKIKNEELPVKIYEKTGIINDVTDEEVNITDEEGYVVAKIDKDGLTDISSLKKPNDSHNITDPAGNIIAKINKYGIDSVNNRINPDDEFIISDPAGNMALKLDKNGLDYIGKSRGIKTNIENINYPTDVVYNLNYGRSLSYHGLIPSGLEMYTCLMFNTTTGDYMLLSVDETMLNNQSALDAFFGDNYINSKTNISGAGVAFLNRKYMELLRDENGIDISQKSGITPNFDYQLIGCNPGEVAGWAGLADVNGVPYRRLLESVRQAKKFALKNNRTFSVGALSYMECEGESTDTIKRFYDKLWVTFSNLNHDIKEITGQEKDVIFMTYQMAAVNALSNPGTQLALAQLQIGLDKGIAPSDYVIDSVPAAYLQSGVELMNRDNIYLGAILYPLDAGSPGNLHATNNSYLSIGTQFGIQAKRCVADKKPIEPIYPKSVKIESRTDGKYIVSIKFQVPYPPLVFDIAGNECQNSRGYVTNYGFSILNVNVEIIENVYLRRGEEIIIICSQNPSGLKLTYAKDGWDLGGNLRDSQGEKIKAFIGSFSYDCHNWCPIFETTL